MHLYKYRDTNLKFSYILNQENNHNINIHYTLLTIRIHNLSASWIRNPLAPWIRVDNISAPWIRLRNLITPWFRIRNISAP